MRIFGFTAYGGPEVTGFLDVADPSPEPGQLLVRTTAAGVNPADVKVRSGQRRGQAPVTFPMAMGREAAGTVVAVGDGVDAGLMDSPVFGATAEGTGALADLVLLDAAACCPRPDAVSEPVAASIPVSVGTAFDALDQLDLPAGSRLLVLGAGGGVGSTACQLALGRGVQTVGVASAGKARLLADISVPHVGSGPEWVQRAAEAVDGGRFDAVLDLVGGDVLREAVPLLTPAGRALSPAAPGLASELLGERGSGVTRRRTRAVFAQIAQLIEAGEVNPIVSATFPFDDARRAFEVVQSGHAAGNVAVTF